MNFRWDIFDGGFDLIGVEDTIGEVEPKHVKWQDKLEVPAEEFKNGALAWNDVVEGRHWEAHFRGHENKLFPYVSAQISYLGDIIIDFIKFAGD